MSITARRQTEPVNGTRLAWLGGIGSLAGLGLAAGLYLAWQDPAGPSPSADLPALLEAPRPEPATLAGMGRAMAALERDLGVWHRLVAPQGPLDLASLRAGLRGDPTPAPAPAREAEEAVATAWNPGRLVLVVLAVLLASVTLVAGLAALLLERTLLGPFRALRGAAAALVDGDLDQSISGLGRDDEAGALARALEGVRHLALAAQAERYSEPASLAEAGLQLEAAARRIECAAAAAAALALEATLDLGQAHPSGVAQGVRDLSHQVVAIRAATERALDAIGHLAQTAASASAGQTAAARVPEEANPR
ncbi:HAMP domain-containing protein [Falsiroseomonas sp. E2-1-a20]|uniref:HAMP domain-containing protein n=1 Tax=Falsiroseomonas sp. E2-1-a20 TaxID=3239300 RepID=UPI003F36AD9F